MSRSTRGASELPTGFVRYVVNAYFPEGGLNMQLAELTDKGTAVELATLIAPELSGAKVRIDMWACEMSEMNEAARINGVLSHAITVYQNSARPGEKLLALIRSERYIGHKG